MAKTYVPNKVNLAFAGITPTGYQKGTFIKITRTVEKWAQESGAHGDIVRTMSHDDSAMVELTLQASSPSNRELSTLYLRDKRNGTGRGAFSVSDLNTEQTLFAGGEAWIVSTPDFDAADTAGTR